MTFGGNNFDTFLRIHWPSFVQFTLLGLYLSFTRETKRTSCPFCRRTGVFGPLRPPGYGRE